MTNRKLDELERKARVASKGPWANPYGYMIAAHGVTIGAMREYYACGEESVTRPQAFANAEYVAAASPDVILDMIREIKEARQMEKLKACPYCDCQTVDLLRSAVSEKFFARCDGCHMQGPDSESRAAASAMWNALAERPRRAETERDCLRLLLSDPAARKSL